MSPPEVIWRLRAKVRDATDACVTARWQRPITNGATAPARGGIDDCGWDEVHLPDPGKPADLPFERAALISRAEVLCNNRLSLFNLKDVHFGDPPQWNYEAEAGITTPMGPAIASITASTKRPGIASSPGSPAATAIWVFWVERIA